MEPDTGLALALAVIAASTAPLVLLDGELVVIAASASFFQTFHVEPSQALNKPLADIGAGEWDIPQFQGLLKATATGAAEVDAYQMDLKASDGATRCVVANVHRLNYGDPSHVRLLLSVADITDARQAEKVNDDLLREKAVLLQEIQHRIANSLQIIASVILQSARQVQSEETRTYLRDAHNRVMSVATLQRQLAASQLGTVALRPYFKQLCESIGASMIRDSRHMTLVAEVDDVSVTANASVSLGLTVTELVINALKHAFPDNASGHITVGYHVDGPDWTLSVTDDGIGMPVLSQDSKGLGTGIVTALAKQLHSRLLITDAKPGTSVSLIHIHAEHNSTD